METITKIRPIAETLSMNIGNCMIDLAKYTNSGCLSDLLAAQTHLNAEVSRMQYAVDTKVQNEASVNVDQTATLPAVCEYEEWSTLDGYRDLYKYDWGSDAYILKGYDRHGNKL